jgi:putative colanic acid biosynthesis acetyltransferase WcaB
MLGVIRADLAANPDPRGKIAMVLFRISSEPSLPRIVRGPLALFYTIIVGWLFGIELPPGTSVGPGLRLNHAVGTVFNPAAVIGANCDIKHGCTIGTRRSGGPSPVLEDGVVLGAGTHVLGEVRLGTGAETGAGAVVLQDVPAGWIAVGNPAHVRPRGRSSAEPPRAQSPTLQSKLTVVSDEPAVSQSETRFGATDLDQQDSTI